jgi:hypothetical protein
MNTLDQNKEVSFLRRGVSLGWWEDVDEEALLPIRVFRQSDFHSTALWAHAWVKIGKFSTVKEAKRAGWNRPLSCGQHRLGTYILRIV